MRKETIKKQLLLAVNNNSFKEAVKKVSLFGSYLYKTKKDSDIDVLVEFKPSAEIGFFELAQMQRELEEFTGRQVDLLTPQSLSKYFRKEVLNKAEIVYER